MANARNLSTLAQGASTAGILGGTYGGTGASLLPTTAGNVIFTADGSVWSSTQKIVRGTVNAGGTNPFPATGGPVAVDYTGIPSWVKRITVAYSGLSTSGTSVIIAQLGSSTFTTTGYLGGAVGIGTSTTVANTNTAGLSLTFTVAAVDIRNGGATIVNITGNTWSSFGTCSLSNTNYSNVFSGSIALSGTLDRIRITTVNGTDTFDAGNINILYE